jgi:hypothetical protein
MKVLEEYLSVDNNIKQSASVSERSHQICARPSISWLARRAHHDLIGPCHLTRYGVRIEYLRTFFVCVSYSQSSSMRSYAPNPFLK